MSINHIFTGADLIFNDYNFSKLLKVESVKKSLMPSFTNISQKITGRDGILFQSTRLEPMEIEIRCRLFAKNRKELHQVKREIAGKLYVTQPKKLMFREDDFYYMVMPNGAMDFNKDRTRAEIVLKFIAYDPVAYGQTVKIVSNGPKIKFDYKGTYKTRGVLKLTLRDLLNEINIRNEGTFEFVKIINLKGQYGTVITIDYDKRLLKIGSNIAMNNLDYSSKFTAIVPGENEFTIPSGCEAELTFEERWL